MAKTDPINIANPAGTSNPKQGDDYIRTLARAVVEILDVDHYVGASSPYSDDEAGEHEKVTLKAVLGADPDPGAGKGALYIKTVNAKPELFYEDADDDVIQLTSGGEVLFGSLSSIANDTYFKAANVAGDGTVDLIKATTGGIPEIKTGAVLSTSGDPTVAAGIACKEYVNDYVDTQIASLLASGISGADESTGETSIGPLQIKWGKANSIAGNTTITIDFTDSGLTDFDNACLNAHVSYASDNDSLSSPCACSTLNVNNLKVTNGHGSTASLFWFAIGY